MRRRDFIGITVAGATGWPLMTGAQQKLPIVGILSATAPGTEGVAIFKRGLSEMDYIEGRNITVETRWASGQYDRLPGLAAELVERGVSIIFAEGNINAARAAKAATAKIPIVFANGGDPVRLSLVASLNRPEANVTGVSFFLSTLGAKRLELMREMKSTIVAVGFLVNPENTVTEQDVTELKDAARSLGLRLKVARAANADDFHSAFASLSADKVDAMLINNDTFFNSRRAELVTLAERYAIPASYSARSFVNAGGLLSYGGDVVEMYRQAGIYAGRILKGAKPSDLPVLQPTKFELAINLKTAKALGLTVPPALLARADFVIE
jgi:putative tryptophan/tyrosine transport system substrate-binding protein